MWTVIGMILLACLGVAAFIVAVVFAALFVIRAVARRRANPTIDR